MRRQPPKNCRIVMYNVCYSPMNVSDYNKLLLPITVCANMYCINKPTVANNLKTIDLIITL
jgi:hypothetical protein